MLSNEIPAPHLATAYSGPLHHIEEVILNQVSAIEGWFRTHWQKTPPSITSSVDLRYAGFKLAPVDTNLFPAGFNNLNPDFMPSCVQAAQSVLKEYYPSCSQILILPENHTRNKFYLQSLFRLSDIFRKAGFSVRIGSLDDSSASLNEVTLDSGEILRIETLIRNGTRLGLPDFDPDLIVLNNDLSSGVPTLLSGIQQAIQPPICMGWTSRLKSTHFHHYAEVAQEFAQLIKIDPWLITPLYRAVEGIDFMSQDGLDKLVEEVDLLLSDIRIQYAKYGIKENPFVVVKADNGTYGMSVMMVHESAQLLSLNRKQRKKMSASKGSQMVTKVIVQEGVHSIETMPGGAVAEPVVYMLGHHVIGGFYRVHNDRGPDENLNAIGMHFEPLVFKKTSNMTQDNLAVEETPNRFYIYGVIARLAALAAAREMAVLGGE